LEEHVAILVDAAEVAGQQPVAGDLARVASGLRQYSSMTSDRAASPRSAFLARRQDVALAIDDRNLAAGAGAAARAWRTSNHSGEFSSIRFISSGRKPSEIVVPKVSRPS